MNAITSRQAFLAYEAVRHRLPEPASTNSAYRNVETLDDLADDFDVFLLDAFGVLNIGETAVPDMPERVRGLQKAGKRVLVVSNSASLPHADQVERYSRLGYDFAPDDVVTSRAALLASLTGQGQRNWGLMAPRSVDIRDLEDLNLSYLEDDPEPYDAVDGFLLFGASSWTETRQALLEAALIARPRPVLVGNPDIAAPREHGFSTQPGHFAHRLADRAGIAPAFFGKPFTNIFDLAFKRLGPVDMSRVLMVGDSLHTDILGASNARIASALISSYGFFAGQDVAAAIALAGITPDFVVARP